MCQCFADFEPGGISCSYRSTEKTRTCGVSAEQMTRMRPSRVVSHVSSVDLTTLVRSSTPSVQMRPHSSRGPKRCSSSTGPERPCWIRLKYIHVDFALITRHFAVSSPSLKWRCTESVCTTATSPFDHG